MKKVKVLKTYKVNSPAKINIGLRILGKRNDGYHNLETIFYPLNLCDNISIEIRNTAKNEIIVNTGGINEISGNKNICYKAVELFLKEFRINSSYRINIRIKKIIPMGAGLGGGSSNAAQVLKVLYKHFSKLINFSTKKSRKTLQKIALQLGSDVPIFLINKPAYGTGRGEKLTPLPDFKINKKILLVNPGIHISTPWAFKELNVKGKKRPSLNRIKNYSSSEEKLMINDFEKVVFRKNPEIEKIKFDMFMLGAEFALMSGSGSTVYGIFSNNMVKEAEKYFKRKKYSVFIS